MRLMFCLLALTLASANENESRARKPVVVDAVGNTLPPPSNVPATVGSPVNLITPDRYEFYTFDESGELVKKLMTLEEIQQIVAAGEETDGLVTFANDDQPTVAFNFSQAPNTKVHSVVTNVQNVLKAQMEAHKNNPMVQPTLDTPDVSDSWSLILPSIFGNTGLDIVPDKMPTNITPPETDTIDLKPEVTMDSFSKEGNNEIASTLSTTQDVGNVNVATSPITMLQFDESVMSTPTTTSTTTTKTTTTSTTTMKTTIPTTTIASTTSSSTTTTTKPPSTYVILTSSKSTTPKPALKLTTASTSLPKNTTSKTDITPATNSTKFPVKTTTERGIFSITKQPAASTTTSVTTKKRSTTTTTTARPINFNTTLRTTSTTHQPAFTTKPVSKYTEKTTSKPVTINKQKPVGTTSAITPTIVSNKTHTVSTSTTTVKNNITIERNSTFVPIPTVAYSTEATTVPLASTSNIYTKPVHLTTVSPNIKSTTTASNKPDSSSHYVTITAPTQDTEKLNITTITTQSVSPSTTLTSTATNNISDKTQLAPVTSNVNNQESLHPLFDVAQSISQIASDLGGNYMPSPTTTIIIDTSNNSEVDLESKENVEIDIISDSYLNKSTTANTPESNDETFIKISTLDPHKGTLDGQANKNEEGISTITNLAAVESTTIDKILSESMGDLLSQIVNQAPQSILESNENIVLDKNQITTEINIEKTTIDDNISNIITTTLRTIQTEKKSDSKYNINNDIVLSNNIPSLNKDETTTFTTVNTMTMPTPLINNKTSNDSFSNKSSNKTYVKIPVIKNNSTDPDATFNKKSSSENAVKQPDVVSNTIQDTLKNVKLQEISTTTVKSSTKFSNTNPTQIRLTTTPPTVVIKTDEYKISGEGNINNTTNPILHGLQKIDEFKKKIQKVNIDDKELSNDRNNSWKLISTVTPPKTNDNIKEKLKNTANISEESNSYKDIVLEFSKENQGLEVTTKDLGEDIAKFTELCNELAFRYWNIIVENIDKRRSFVLSPYSITSMLAMMFMGARGATSGEMNDILKLDDMVTFNPHFTLKNVSDSIETSAESGVAVSAFIRELYSDKTKGKILTFYKERAQQFYNGHVEEINFQLISDIIRRRTNLLVKRYTWGKILEYMKSNSIVMHPPLAAFSANIFQTDCTGSSVEGRDGEMYFVVSPGVRQRRLVPVPAVVYRKGFLAGYDPALDATAAALGNTNSIISTLFVMPGQQGNVVHAEDLESLEKRLLDANPTTPAWNRLLRTLLPRMGLELQIPRFSHKSIFNISSTLRNMGLKDLFDAQHADLGGLNGPSKDLYLSDMIQCTSFVTCGESVIGEQHHMEEYPESLESIARRRSSRWASDWDEPRDYQRAFHDPHDVGEAMHLPLHLRPRQARLPSRTAQPARLKFDRPFLYFVRHNPTGMILYVGRYNPRLLP